MDLQCFKKIILTISWGMFNQLDTLVKSAELN